MGAKSYKFIVVPDTNIIYSPGLVDDLFNKNFSGFINTYTENYVLKEQKGQARLKISANDPKQTLINASKVKV